MGHCKQSCVILERHTTPVDVVIIFFMKRKFFLFHIITDLSTIVIERDAILISKFMAEIREQGRE